MPRHLRLTVSLAFAACLGVAAAQPLPLPAPGAGPMAGPVPPGFPSPNAVPLLFVKIMGPATGQVTVFEAGGSRTFAAPLAIGLRPGVRYRFSVEGLDPKSIEPLFGSIVVYDVLRLPPNKRAAEFPATVNLTLEDLTATQNGAMVSKWLVLEDPNRKPTVQLTPGVPAEINNFPGDDAKETAELLGRPLALVHLGGREPMPEDTAGMPPGLIVYPSDAAAVESVNDPRFLPIIQPPKGGEEVVKDGGDSNGPIHFDIAGDLHDVNPTDTAATFKNYLGDKKLVISNRVCVVAPRYVLVRDVTPLVQATRILEPTPLKMAQAGEKVARNQPSYLKRQVDEAEILRRRDRLRANIMLEKARTLVEIQPLGITTMVLEPHVAIGRDELKKLTLKQQATFKRQVELANTFTRVEGVVIAKDVVGTKVVGVADELGRIEAIYEPRDITFICEPEPQLPDQPLFIQKWASTDSAQPGDIVTFSISYKNIGGKPIREIAVVDSLSGRLEYVPGSAQSDREAVFVTQENEVGSSVLRWEIKEPLPAGKHGVVKFKAKVR